MPGVGTDWSKLTVGSLLGIPLGATATVVAAEAAPGTAPVPSTATPPSPITEQEGPWTVADGDLRRASGRPGASFRSNGMEALSYDNPFGQSIEQVWFDGKVVYALDVGAVDVDPQRVTVAQEYQVVYAVDMDDGGKLKAEPERVPGQLNIYDSVPGMPRYSPIWQFNYVVVPRDYPANTLRSEAACLASGYPIRRSQVFEN